MQVTQEIRGNKMKTRIAKEWIVNRWKSARFRKSFAAAAVLATALSVGSYEVLKPTAAIAASAAPAATALDENSVSALLTLDRAMETLAARVTPAVVNVTVAARHKAEANEQDDQEGGIQRFFGPDSP